MAATSHPALRARLAEIRQELSVLIGDIDTRVRPRPDEVVTGDGLPGPVWRPGENWTIRVVDPDSEPICVFVSHPYIWDDDIFPLRPEDARRIGMAFLAAADWAERIVSADVERASSSPRMEG